MGKASGPSLDITVPYADENRNHVLLRQWRHQGGDAMPAPPVTLPRRSEGAYRIKVRRRELLGLVVEHQYSDAIAGKTGGVGGHYGEHLMMHVTFSGEWRFQSGDRRAVAGPGSLCLRRNEDLWNFEVARGTRADVMLLPTGALRLPARARAITAEQTSPAAALLLAQLRLWTELADDLSVPASQTARNATLELLQGLVNDQVVDDAEVAPALVRAGMDWIEDRLAGDPDLDPRTIAGSLGVSVRTLYRAFNQHAPMSVMAYVRERRLERARAELSSTRLTVSEIAARWHFTDSSHFTRAYKKRYGKTPAAGRKE